MNDRTIVVAAFIVGGAIVAASFQPRARYALSSAGNNVVWRMDTWSGQIDVCAATYLPTGPLVQCGALALVPTSPPATAPPSQAPPDITNPRQSL